MSSVRLNRRQAGVLACAIALSIAVTGAAFADGPESDPDGDPNVQVTVTPSDNLTNGQAVNVSGTGFFASSPNGTLRLCTTGDAPLCSEPIGTFTTNSSRNFGPISVNVPQTFTAESDTGPQTIDCAVTACRLNASQFSSFASHHLTFAGGPTTSTSTTTTLPPTTTTTVTLPPTTTTTTTTLPPTTTTTTTTLPPTTTTTTTVPPTTTTTTTLPPTTTTTTTLPPTSTTTTTITLPPTTTTTTTLPPTTTTTTSTTTLPPTTTSTTLPGGTTTTTIAGDACASLQALRVQFNAQLDQLVATVNQQFTGETRTALLARLAQARASGNASIDQAIQACRSSAT